MIEPPLTEPEPLDEVDPEEGPEVLDVGLLAESVLEELGDPPDGMRLDLRELSDLLPRLSVVDQQ